MGGRLVVCHVVLSFFSMTRPRRQNNGKIDAGLEFSRLESWSRDASRRNFHSLGLGLGTFESWSLSLGLDLGSLLI